MPILNIVATPIGNLEDITLRALRVLKEVDVILCEDTRVTKKILQKYDINKATISYHSQSSFSKIEKIIGLLKEGKNIALVSDAGTPTISDPGVFLIRQIKETLGDVVKIEPIPGPSAVITALSASGVPSSSFLFLGFLPHKKGRKTLFREIKESKRTVVFYESPHRIMKTLNSLQLEFGETDVRKIVLAREITKIYEEFLRGTPNELIEKLEANPEKQKGEFVVVVEGVC